MNGITTYLVIMIQFNVGSEEYQNDYCGLFNVSKPLKN